MIITITWISVVILALVLYLRQVYTTFSKAGINHLPVVPIFGDFFWAFFNFENATKSLERLGESFPDDKILGQYEMLNPVYVLQDVELIKNITIKDFDHFVDRRSFVTENDSLFGRGLLNLKGDEWKEMRSTLSPAFTSSKIRPMVPLMVEVGEEMNKVIKRKIKDSGKTYIDVDLKDLTTRYANDVIASCAFGLKEDSQSQDNSFYTNALDITSFGLIKVMKVFFCKSVPSLASKLNISITSPKASGFFQDVVLSTMEHRDKKNIIRHDMIKLLNDIKKGKLSHEKETDTDAGFATVEESNIGKKLNNRVWTDQDLVAQAVLFLVAGFDTVSTVMIFTLYELALHPDVQDKLSQEIMEYDHKNGGKFDFNSIQSMKYMDMVVSEALRKYPPAPILDRVCIKDYNLGRANKNATNDTIIRKGDTVGCIAWNFHRNSKYFPNPDKFDPERFSDENKHNIKPYSYMPFGLGPRNCIGSRFALCEVKVMLYQLLREIKVTPGAKTSAPVQLTDGFIMGVKNGAWVRFEIRE